MRVRAGGGAGCSMPSSAPLGTFFAALENKGSRSAFGTCVAPCKRAETAPTGGNSVIAARCWCGRAVCAAVGAGQIWCKLASSSRGNFAIRGESAGLERSSSTPRRASPLSARLRPTKPISESGIAMRTMAQSVGALSQRDKRPTTTASVRSVAQQNS